MKIFKNNENIKLKIEEIREQIILLGEVPGNIIDYTTVTQIQNNLSDIKKVYEDELKQRLEKEKKQQKELAL